jgi:hypothetical protein
MPTVIDWPVNLRPASVEWGMAIPQRMAVSTFSGSGQASVFGAPRWVFTINTGVIRAAEVPDWEAFLDQLDGMSNRVRAWDWRREQPLGPATGTPTVRVAGGGTSLQTQGWAPNINGVLLRGSYMGINDELKRLSGSINSDSLGRATITFRPPTRANVPVGTPLVLVKPTAKFYMTTERPVFRQDGARHPPVSLSFEEDPAS